MSLSKKHQAAIKLVDTWLTHYLPHKEVPGASVGITIKGELVYKKGFGFTDTSKKIKATQKTNYRIASISKSFTAVSILQLVEKDLLRLDDKVQKYLPWFKSEKDTKLKQITIRQLLSHSAGLRREGGNFMWDTGKFPIKQELVSYIDQSVSILEPNTAFKYSNLGFAVLGQVIEEISEMTYEQYVTRNIFNPLGMKSSLVDYSKTDVRLASGYSRKLPGHNRKMMKHYATNAFQSATGLSSNVEDLAKYIQALSSTKNSIISIESKKEMQRVQFMRKGEESHYGFGMMVDYSINGCKLVEHDGGFPGFETIIAFEPDMQIGVVVLTNCNSSPKHTISDQIFKTFKKVNTDLHQKKDNVEKYAGMYSGLFWSSYFLSLMGNLIDFNPYSETPADFNILKRSEKLENTFIDTIHEGYMTPKELIKFVADNDKISYVDSAGYKLIPHKKYLKSIS